jgi:hypothetical protein
VRLGAFDVPGVPATLGAPIADVERGLEMNLDGLLGSGLLGAFRVTMTDGGRSLWIEDVPGLPDAPPQAAPAEPPPPPAAAPEKPTKPAKPASPAKRGKKPSD